MTASTTQRSYTMLVDMSLAVYSVENTSMVSEMKQITILSEKIAMIHQSKRR